MHKIREGRPHILKEKSNEHLLKLLGLSRDNYAIVECVIGFPKKYPEIRKENKIDDYATWI